MTTPTVTTPASSTSQAPTYDNLLAAITDPGGREVLDPATGEDVGHVAERSPADLDDAVEAAAEPLAELLSREQGKPLNGPNARFEVGACAAWLRATAAPSCPWKPWSTTRTHTPNCTTAPSGWLVRSDRGNWPMMITIWQVAPALRMGNTVVVKPSEYTPLSVLALVEVLCSVLPADVLTAVAGGREVGARLTSHPDVDKLMFTGSTATGQAIIKSSADTVKRLTLELGGNDAGIVLPDVDPKAIAQDLFWGAFSTPARPARRSSACTCTPTSMTRAARRSSRPRRPCPWVGDWTSRTYWARCRTGRVRHRCGWSTPRGMPGPRSWSAVTPQGTPLGTSTRPRSWPDVDNDNPLVAEEQFGPALPIVRYEDLDQAVSMANALDVGLGASVWSSDRDAAREVAHGSRPARCGSTRTAVSTR